MSSKFLGKSAGQSKLAQIVNRFNDDLQQNGKGAGYADSALIKAVISTESFSEVQSNEIDTINTQLTMTLESVWSGVHGDQAKATDAQMMAARVAGIMAGDVRAAFAAPITHNVVSTEGLAVVNMMPGDGLTTRMREALEAYEEKENKNVVAYSMAYNMHAARQDEFGEALFPTIIVTPDQLGYTVSIRITRVYDEMRRDISGAVNDFKFRNIIQATIDPTILRNDATNIVPVFRDETEDFFVPDTLITPREILNDGQPVTTSVLAFGKKFSLLGISQTDALIATGLMDTTDTLDPAIELAAVYVSIPGANQGDPAKVIKFNTARLPGSAFNHAVQGNSRQMNLAANLTALHVDGSTKDLSGAAIASLAAIGNGNLSVRLAIDVYGSVNLHFADTSLKKPDVVVHSITNANGEKLPLDSGTGAQIVALFEGAEAVGYDLNARRTNLNRRQRGQLLDTQVFNQLYPVPLRSPITIPRPLATNDQNEATDLGSLITTTHIRTSNAAVATLREAANTLKEYVSQNDKSIDTAPEILGAARFLVTPVYVEDSIDAAADLDSLKASERTGDVQALLVNKIRDIAWNMYRDSGYKAASASMNGGIAVKPTVIVATDPVLAAYLMVEGDLRTLGDSFEIKVVSSLNRDIKGEIYVTFGDFNSVSANTPNPMHFGNMAWKPELTTVLPIHRNGGNSKELTVMPSFQHFVNLPILGKLVVSNIDKVVAGKVAVQTTNAP